MTWPLSRDAVEAAAQVLFSLTTAGAGEWSDAAPYLQDVYRARAAAVLRAALAAWEPSDGQVRQMFDVVDSEFHGKASVGSVLIAAARTEADE